MAQYDGSIRINTLIDTKNASSQMMGLVNQIQKASDKVNSLRAKMDAFKDVKIPTQEYKEISDQIQKAETELNRLIEKQGQMQREGKDHGSSWERLVYKIEEVKNTIQYAKGELKDLVDTGKAFTLGQDTQEYANLGQQLRYAENDLARLNRRYDELNAKQGRVPEQFEKMRKSAKKAFDAISSGSKKSSVSLDKGFKSILKYGFGIRSIYVLFNKIRAGIKQGFENLMNYSNETANSIQSVKNSTATLGNQIAAAFAPIVQMVVPWLNALINAISTAMSYVAQFIAILGGSSTFTRAKKVQDSYNKSLGGTAKAADKARGALAKFDDLDVLQKQEDASGGGAGGAGAGNLFEEVPVDPKLSKWLDAIIERVKELKDIFMEGFWDGLGDLEYRLEIIKNSLSSIKDSLIEIWTDPQVLSSSEKWVNSVAYMLGSLAGSVASIGLTIGANIFGGIAKYLQQNKERIKRFLISVFDIWSDVNVVFSDLFQSIAYVFEAFASEDGQQLTANIIGIFANAFMGINEFVSNLFRDLSSVIIQPFVDNKEGFRTAIEGFLSVLSSITGTIKQGIDDTFDKLNEVYDESIKPFFDSVANGLSGLVGHFLEFWNGSVQPILDEFALKFSSVWVEYIQPAIGAFIELIGEVAELLMVLWENILSPLIDWIVENILPIVLPILDGILNGFLALLSGISEIVKGIIDVIKGIITFLTGVFSLDWKKAWDGAKKIFEGFKGAVKGIIDTVLGIIKAFIDSVMDMVDKAINAIKSIGGAAGGISGGVGSAVMGASRSAAPSMASYSAQSFAAFANDLPHLASGSVIRGGNPFMAVLGDQPRGQVNVETPASLIKDMVAQGIIEAGIENRANIPVNINLNYDGETFARLSISDILSELDRQGYNVSVLGVN